MAMPQSDLAFRSTEPETLRMMRVRWCVTYARPGLVTPNANLPASLASFGVPGLGNAYRFAIFNALSYQIVLGSPMVLYAKSLDASATVLGIIAGMMPLLVIFQIPAARHIARVGYKRFVYAGWGTRVMFIFLMASVPLASRFLTPPNRIAVMMFLLFGFNLSRGISSAAWLPWITALVPAPVRGRYLARDSACVNAASAITLVLAGAVLGDNPSDWRFAAIFAFSALTGAVSLSFLKRIPDAPDPEAGTENPEPVPWREIAAYRPFRKLLRMNVAWSLAYGGLGAFTVAYLKTSAGLAEDLILYATAVSYVGGIGGLVLFGSRLDHHGSKPVLLVCLLGWIGVLAGWVLLAGNVVPVHLALLLGLHGLMGLGYAVFSMANTRLAMAVVPVMGRNHFFAFYSVLANLSLGVAPVLWGLLIDALGDGVLRVGRFEINRFSLFFFLVLGVFGVTAALCRRLHEPRAAPVEDLLRDLLSQTPLRSWIRFWPRG
ncbi:MAG TPA: MFS transporter [Verrucomicrobiota bacterium]|nr:MFS transporter [Verrucomicrobiota bacterium]